MARWALALITLLPLAGCGGGQGPLAPLQARLELKKGNLSYLAGDYGQAVAHYDKALGYTPVSWRASLNRAYSLVALFRLSHEPLERRRLADQAIESFDGYRKLRAAAHGKPDPGAPTRERVDQYVLTLLLDSGQADQASTFLQARLAANPRDVPAVLMLSSISVDHGDLEGAARWLRRRLEIEPDRPEAHYAFGVFAWRVSYYNMTGNAALRARLLNEGLSELGRALELRPDYFEACSYLNLLYRELARGATSDAERAGYEALARQFRDRATTLKKSAPLPAPATPAGGGR